MSKVEVSNEGPIKTITLNRPEKRNALDQEMLNNLYDIFSEKVSAAYRLIVLKANGPFNVQLRMDDKDEPVILDLAMPRSRLRFWMKFLSLTQE